MVGLKLPPEIDEALAEAARANKITKSDFAASAIQKQLPRAEMRRRGPKKSEPDRLVYVTFTPEQIAAIRFVAEAAGITFDEVVSQAVAVFLKAKR